MQYLIKYYVNFKLRACESKRKEERIEGGEVDECGFENGCILAHIGQYIEEPEQQFATSDHVDQDNQIYGSKDSSHIMSTGPDKMISL